MQFEKVNILLDGLDFFCFPCETNNNHLKVLSLFVIIFIWFIIYLIIVMVNRKILRKQLQV
jgi:hypothetical protein